MTATTTTTATDVAPETRRRTIMAGVVSLAVVLRKKETANKVLD